MFGRLSGRANISAEIWRKKKKADTIYKQVVERKNGPVRGNSKGRDVAARK